MFLQRKIVSIMKLAALVCFLSVTLVKGVSATPSDIIDAYTYSTIDMPGAHRTVATGINDTKSVVGIYNNQGFIYTENRDCSITTLKFPGANYTMPFGINNKGNVVGVYESNHKYYGFVANNNQLPLPRPWKCNDFSYLNLNIPGADITSPRDINNRGQVVGLYGYPGKTMGFIYNPTYNTTTYKSYSTLSFPGSPWTSANGINDNGIVVGSYADNGYKRYHGFIYNGKSYLTLDVPDAISTFANGINNRGDVVGTYTTNSGETHGFIYNGTSYLILDVPDAISTLANGINNIGNIVGSYTDVKGEVKGEYGFIAAPAVPTVPKFPRDDER